MRTVFGLTIWSLALALSLPLSVYAAEMTDYCSAPPYVTRTIPPNVMILMDNSEDMMTSAYGDTYDPDEEYMGYFRPEACYSYSGKFQEGTPNGDGTCPSTAPYRGSLMNWATMSKYDVLQKVILGGNATSKQGNAHTLVSISGSWMKSYPENECVFEVAGGNLVIRDVTEGSCSLLDNPKTPVALQIPDVDTAPFVADSPAINEGWLAQAPEWISGTSGGLKGALEYLSSLSLTNEAHAATVCSDIRTASSLNRTTGEDISLVLEASGCNNCTFTWSDLNVPDWLGSPVITDMDKLTNGRITWSNSSDPAPGTYDFSATVERNNCTGTDTITGEIVVTASVPDIDTTGLTSGQVGEDYEAQLVGQGGTGNREWSVSGLPPGLTWTETVDDSSRAIAVISGTPTEAGIYWIDVTLTDSVGASDTRALSLIIGSSSSLHIVTESFPDTVSGSLYSFQMQAGGGSSPYTWQIPSGGDISPSLMSSSGLLEGTAGAAGIRNFTVRVTDANGQSEDKAFTLTVVEDAGPLTLLTTELNDAVRDTPYSFPLSASGGTKPYNWALAADAPEGMDIDEATGRITWTPTNQQRGDHSFTVLLEDDSVADPTPYVLSITVLQSSPGRSDSFTVKVELTEEDLTDENGNDIHDAGEAYTDSNGNGEWDGKKGLFQKFWSTVNPRARWGLTKFKDSGADDVVIDACVPASPASSFYTSVQNATWSTDAQLASGLYGAVQYYGFNTPYGNGYGGCSNSDPINNVPCRKNFVLIITSGSDVSGTTFADTTACTDARPLVKNACVGYTSDLRDDRINKQNVYTYIVNTMGSSNNDVLADAAAAGGGKYYEATSYTELEASLVQAFEDILAQAASGTAVSVLTTSSRGIGSMVQAYFLPIRQDGEREVRWTGYTQNIWIDNKDNLREDTVNDHKLHPDQDRVLKLFFDSETNETKAALFTTDDEGNVDNCTTPTIEPFSEVSYNWEGGTEVALQNPDDRTLFTAKKEIRVTDASGTVAERTISNNSFTVANITGSTSDSTLLTNALDPDATYSAADIVRYTRGECLETGVTGNTACGSTVSGTFRDRRVTIEGAKKVWKLGDIISSTPKVLTNSPQNTYHLDYGDNTYYQYISSSDYRNRVSLALVGANDGVLHAFRVGYLKDRDLTGGFKGIFQNAQSDLLTDKLGKEAWGYIPLNAFPYLKYLANPNYCHIYFNDLSIRLVDASLGDTDDADHDGPTDDKVMESWRTIALGGMRFGGGCADGVPEPPLADTGFSVYYALDVTDPLHPVPLWEFSDVDMGFATSFPSVIRTGNKGKNGNWYVVVGSGSERLPKSNVDIGRDSTGYIYILDLKTGAMVKKISLDHNGIVGDVLAIDANRDYTSGKLYFGTSYFDAGTWKGKLASITIPEQDLSASWTPEVKYLLTGDYPITASPDAAKDAVGTVWVYGGSGKYFSDVDESDVTEHVMFGIKDLSSITYPVSAASGLQDQTNVTTEGTVTGTTTACMHNPTSNKFEERTMVTSIAQTSGAVSVPSVGWKMHLSPGERVITRPLAVGGLVDFLTYKPSSDECSYGGDSYLYALDYVKGIAPSNIAIRSPDTTTDADGNAATSGSVTVAKGVKLGPGAPPTGEAIIVPPPKEGQDQLKKKIQIATGVIIEAENTPVISVVSKMVHWLKK